MTHNASTALQEKITPDCVAFSSHTVVAISKTEIIDCYDKATYEVFKNEMTAKGNDFICEVKEDDGDEYVYFGIDAGQSPHDYIHCSMDALVGRLDCVGWE